jgi:hypothetical protein
MSIKLRRGMFETELADLNAVKEALASGSVSLEDEVWDPIAEKWRRLSDLLAAAPVAPTVAVGGKVVMQASGVGTAAHGRLLRWIIVSIAAVILLVVAGLLLFYRGKGREPSKQAVVGTDANSGWSGGDDAGSSATVTVDGSPFCPLGWPSGLTAINDGSRMAVVGRCGGGRFDAVFEPLAADGSAPATSCGVFGPPPRSRAVVSCAGRASHPEAPTGSVTVTGSTGNFRVEGECSCTTSTGTVSITLGLPVTVR